MLIAHGPLDGAGLMHFFFYVCVKWGHGILCMSGRHTALHGSCRQDLAAPEPFHFQCSLALLCSSPTLYQSLETAPSVLSGMTSSLENEDQHLLQLGRALVYPSPSFSR